MLTVRFFVQRHGKYDSDFNLTEEGKQQVQQSAKKHCTGVNFDYAFSSEQARARQTAEHALVAVGQEQLGQNIRVEQGFGYLFAEDQRWPHEKLLEQIAEAKRAGHTITVDFVIAELRNPPIIKMAAGLLMTMHQWAQRIAERGNSADTTINVLVGSHGTNVLATLEPQTTPWAAYADIMCYQFEVNEQGESKLVASHYMPA